YAFARGCHGELNGLAALGGQRRHLRLAPHVRQVALVELDHDRQIAQRDAVSLEVFAQVDERLTVVLRLLQLRVGNEDDAIGALHDQTSRRGVYHLPRYRKDLEADGDAAFAFESERQQVEEQRSIVFGLKRHQTPCRLLVRRVVERL